MIRADEDVGKVATATPIVVCQSPASVLGFKESGSSLWSYPPAKALELFLKNLVDESVKDADSRGSKKVTAYGLSVGSQR